MHKGPNPPKGYRLITKMVQLEGTGGGRDHGLRRATEDDIPTCREIARTFVYDRLHSDPLFPDRAADAIKADWIERNILEDTVWVHGFPTLGFVSLKDNRLELIAVDPDFRGMGYGEKLIEHTLHNAPNVLVGTQHNNPALKLYQRLGFKVVEEYDVWHGRDS
jgi:ribosomal protein S18 acetylase RimI-like enzyme